MSEPFIGEIRMFGFDFPPRGWANCSGQTLPIAQNQALFSILGTTYGGNGQTNFQLPNLQGKAPIHFGNEIALGQQGGEQAHTLIVNEIPQHQHSVSASTAAVNSGTPAASYLTTQATDAMYATAGNATMSGTTTPTGGNQPHENMQPYLVVNFSIALVGVFPSRN